MINQSWEEFQDRLKRRYPGVIIQAEPRIGSTNSARFLRGGMKVGIPNLLRRTKLINARDSGVAWAFVGKILLPGVVDSELFIALIFEHEVLPTLLSRLDDIDRISSSGGNLPTNNTRLVLHSSGFYMTVVQESESIEPQVDPEAYGPPLPLSQIVYADVERNGQLTKAELDVVARIKANYSDPSKVVRLEDDGSAVENVGLPEQMPIDELAHRVNALGGFYERQTLEVLHLNLTHNPAKHFVILRGISGTGKSRLAQCYAYAVLGADSLLSVNERFVVVPVEPQWSDPSYLVGHRDILSESGYSETSFSRALLLADADPLRPVFVLLDEMNRAQVEHYFSNFLSAMELQDAIRFHAESEALQHPSSIPWPSNLYLIGTINDDESTIPFSPMVLDRANSQDLSNIDVVAYCLWLRKQEPSLAIGLGEGVISILESLSEILRPLKLHFGYRTVREIALYLSTATRIGVTFDPLDIQIDQKILPKLHGGEEASGALQQLLEVLSDFPISHRRVNQMKSDLERSDFFRYL